MKYCKNCNHQLADDDRFCEVCGARVEENSDFASEQPTRDVDYYNPYYSPERAQTPPASHAYKADWDPNASENQTVAGFPADRGRNGYYYQGQATGRKNTASAGTDLKKVMIPLIIVGVLVVFLIVGLVVFHIVSKKINKAPIQISLSDYLSDGVFPNEDLEDTYNEYDYSDYEGISSVFKNLGCGAGLLVFGYNDYATIDSDLLYNVVEWEKLTGDVNKALGRKKTDRKMPLQFEDFFQKDTFAFSADASEDLSNEQIVTVSVSTGTDTFQVGDVTIQVSGGEMQYTIKGLETVAAIDPFDYVNLVTFGPNGNASVDCLVDRNLNEKINGLEGFRAVYYDDTIVAIEKDGYTVNKFSYQVNNRGGHYQNGDSVSMYCSNGVSSFEETYHVHIARYTKDYTVSGLGEYLTRSDRLSDKEIASFVNYAKTVIQEEYTNDRYSNFRFYRVYFADTKDKTTLPSYDVNKLCVVYSYDVTDWWYGETDRKYMFAEFDDIILTDGKLFKTASSYYDGIEDDYEDLDELLLDLEDDGRYIVLNLETDMGSEADFKTTVTQTTEPITSDPAPAEDEQPVLDTEESEYLFPSDTELLTTEYLDTLSDDQINLIRNEIYARHGYIFKKEVYKNYFESQSWYHGYDSDMDNVQKSFNEIERKNIDILVEYQGLNS